MRKVDGREDDIGQASHENSERSHRITRDTRIQPGERRNPNGRRGKKKREEPLSLDPILNHALQKRGQKRALEHMMDALLAKGVSEKDVPAIRLYVEFCGGADALRFATMDLDQKEIQRAAIRDLLNRKEADRPEDDGDIRHARQDDTQGPAIRHDLPGAEAYYGLSESEQELEKTIRLKIAELQAQLPSTIRAKVAMQQPASAATGAAPAEGEADPDGDDYRRSLTEDLQDPDERAIWEDTLSRGANKSKPSSRKPSRKFQTTHGRALGPKPQGPTGFDELDAASPLQSSVEASAASKGLRGPPAAGHANKGDADRRSHPDSSLIHRMHNGEPIVEV